MSTSRFKPIGTARYLFDVLANARDGDSFCKQIVHYLHASHGVIGCFLTRLDKAANIRWIGRYGHGNDTSNVAALSVWDKSASAEAILSGTPNIYSKASTFENKFETKPLEHPSGNGLLVMPLKLQGQAAGSMGISFAGEISEDLKDDENFEIVGLGAQAFLSYLTVNIPNNYVRKAAGEESEITTRDLEILNLLDQGLTHNEIGRRLNLSESTIKQTSSLLYKKLGVSKRLDAVDKGKFLRLI